MSQPTCFCRVNITFIDRDNDKTTVQAKVGDTLLDVAKDNDIDLEGIFCNLKLLLDVLGQNFVCTS